MLRWWHERVTKHDWQEVSHRHDVEADGEAIDCYLLTECKCGAIREEFMIKHEIPSPIPGIALDRLEDAKVWAS